MSTKNGKLMAWRSIHQAYYSKDAGKHKRCMAMILLTTRLTPSEFQRRCNQLYATDSVEGAEAVAWGLQQIATMTPSGKERNMILEQMDNARNDAAIMRKIRKGWKLFGEDDPWWVVHDKPVRALARYNSEPTVNCGKHL